MEKEAEVYKAFLNTSEQVISDPFLLFKGRIESFSIDESINQSNANIVVASHWSDFSKIEGRKTNTGSQQLHFSGDLGFEFASQTTQDIKWGKA